MTPFDTNWGIGGGATPLTIQDLFFGDAISIPTASTNSKRRWLEAKALISPAMDKDFHPFATPRKDETPADDLHQVAPLKRGFFNVQITRTQ
jgi:hypothetical protein